MVYIWSNAEFPAKRGAQQQISHQIMFSSTVCSEIAVVLHLQYRSSVNISLLIEEIRRQSGNTACRIFVLPIVGRSYTFIFILALIALTSAWRIIPYCRRLRNELMSMHPSVVHLEGFPLLPLTWLFPKASTVACPRDAFSLRFKRFGRAARGPLKRLVMLGRFLFARLLERSCLPRARFTHVVSNIDGSYYRDLYPAADVRVIGVRARPVEAPAVSADRSVREPGRILLFGDAREPQIRSGFVAFFRDVAPQVDPTLRIRVLGRRSDLARDLGVDGTEVECLDFVPNLAAELARATCIVLCDTDGTGQKNRLLDALAAGTPVIASPAAVEGFDLPAFPPFVVAANPAEMASAINRVCMETETWSRLAAAIPGFMEPHLPQTVDAQWLELYATLGRCA